MVSQNHRARPPKGRSGRGEMIGLPRILALAALAAAAAACVAYRPAPLPSPEESARPAPPDFERLRVAAADLKHPVLKPIALDLSRGLTPDQAAVLAVLANPDLIAARDAHGIAAAQLMAAGLLPNPTLNVEADRPYGAGSEGTSTNVVASAGFDVGALVGRAARVRAAQAELAEIDLEIAWQEWQVAQSARLQALRVASLDRRIAAGGDELDYEEHTLAILNSALEKGDATLPGVGVQRSSVENLRQIRSDLERDRLQARAEINRVLGLAPGTVLAITLPQPIEDAKWSDLPAADALFRVALDSRLDLQALRRGYEAQEARVRSAVLAQFPELSIGLVRQRDETRLNFFGGFVTLALPFFNRQQAAIQLEESTREHLRREYDARLATLRSEIAAVVETDGLYATQIAQAQAAIQGLSKIEQAERAAALQGDVDRLSYQTVRGSLFEMRLRLASLAQARAEGRIALEAAVGRVMPELTPGGQE